MKRPTLRFSLLSSLLALMLFAIVAIASYSYSQNVRAMLDLRDDLLDQVSHNINQRTHSYLKPAIATLQTGRQLIATAIENEINTEQLQDLLKHFCIEQLKAYPQLHFVYYSDINGNYFGVERRSGNNLVVWILSVSDDNKRRLEYHHLDQNFQTANIEILSDFDYFPRERPWYKNAERSGQQSWTNVYIFYSEKPVAGITCSDAITVNNELAGVFAADLTLENISDFLSELSIGKTGVAFLVNEANQIIAYPNMDLSDQKVEQSEQEFKLIEAGKTSNEWVNAVYNAWLQRSQGREESDGFLYDYQGAAFVLSARPMRGYFDDRWKIIAIVPEDDFIGVLRQTNQAIIVFSIFIILITILVIIVITNKVAIPIKSIARSTNALSRLEFDETPALNSPIKEIVELHDSMVKLRIGLMAFNQYVPTALVRRLMKSDVDLAVGGRKKNMTIFFSDIVSFTSIAENADPEFLMHHVSDYLEAMTSHLVKHHATIDKYIGDSIMAFWGAPDNCERQEELACLAALECHAHNLKLNEEWIKQGKPPLSTRIGLASGDTVVGNIGSSDRLNYTVLGDIVNLASRLEGTNKTYRTFCLVNEQIHNKLPADKYILRALDIVKVKGKSKSNKIYQLIAAQKDNGEWINPVFPQLDIDILQKTAKLFDQAFEEYLQTNWDKAEELVLQVLAITKEDYPATDFLNRIRKFRQNPPDADWAGARTGFRHTD